MNRIRIAIGFLVVGLFVSSLHTSTENVDAVTMPEIQKEQLYKFRNAHSRWLFKRGSTVPAAMAGKWINEGVVCFIARNPSPGLKPVYLLAQTDQYGAFYGYSTNPAHHPFFKGGNVNNIGPEFYVAATQLPGTVPLYGFWSRGLVSSDGFKQILSGTSTYFMSTDKQPPNANYDKLGILGYVWTGTTFDDDQRPDLTIVKTTVRENGIEAIIRNSGKKSASSQPGVTAVLTVIDKNGKPLHFSGAKQLGGMSAGQQRPFLFETGNLLPRSKYRVQVDAGNAVAESDENNNDTDFIEIPGRPKIKINPLPADHVQPPSVSLTDVKGVGAGRMNYSFTVTNWDKYKPEWFMSLVDVLPPEPCGGKETNARLVAHAVVIKNSGNAEAACKPLNTPADLRTITFTSLDRLSDADRVRIHVEDRATGTQYESSAYPVGVFGVDKVLVPMGCKFFLGRASSYVCSSDQGFAACENLRKKGKPIECRKPGKGQP